jgi:hypothetical protein
MTSKLELALDLSVRSLPLELLLLIIGDFEYDFEFNNG